MLRVQMNVPLDRSPAALQTQKQLEQRGVKGRSYFQLPLQCPPHTPPCLGGWEPHSPVCWCLERVPFVLEGGRLCLWSRRPVFHSPPYKLSQPQRSSHPAATWAAGAAEYFHRQVLFLCLASPWWQMSVCGWDAWRDLPP